MTAIHKRAILLSLGEAKDIHAGLFTGRSAAVVTRKAPVLQDGPVKTV